MRFELVNVRRLAATFTSGQAHATAISRVLSALGPSAARTALPEQPTSDNPFVGLGRGDRTSTGVDDCLLLVRAQMKRS